MGSTWTDDERNASYNAFTGTTLTHTKNTYMPVWQILKEMYDEDKEALYAYTDSNSNSIDYSIDYEQDLPVYCDYETLSEYGYDKEHYDTEDDYGSCFDSDESESVSDSDQSFDLNDLTYSNKYIYI